MPSPNSTEIEMYERAYAAWMNALLYEIGGKKADLHRLLESASKPMSRFRGENGAQIVRTWFDAKRLTLPNNDYGLIVERLSKLAVEKLSEPPPGSIPDVGFLETIEVLRSLRTANQKEARKYDISADKIHDAGATKFRPKKISGLNELELLLGSSIFEGEVPPYCARDIDTELKVALEDDRKLVVLVGPPKSGKTRTLVHNLKDSKLAENDIYWLDAATPNAIELVAKEIGLGRLKNPVVMLDDLQLFPLEGPGSVTPATFRTLLEATKVVATLHAADAQTWRLSDFDKASTAKMRNDSSFADHKGTLSTDLKNSILRGSFEISETLTAMELGNAAIALGKPENSDEIKHLGSYLSASEYLVERAKFIKFGNNPYELAFLNALISAKIIWPAGITMDSFKELYSNQLHSNTNLPWNESAWSESQLTFLTGASPSSPHALMMRSIGDRMLYQLFDGAWDAVKPKQWELSYGFPPLELELSELAEIGFSGYPQEAIRLMLASYEGGNSLHDFFLGHFFEDIQNLPMAEKHLLLAIKSGDLDALHNLAIIYGEQGRLAEAEDLYKRAVEGGVTDSLLNLARLYHNGGRIADAEKYYLMGIDAGDSNSLYNLALLYGEMERFDDAAKYYRLAIEEGVEDALHNLAILESERGNHFEAERLYLQGVSDKDMKAMNNLGVYYESVERWEDAEKFYELGVKAGNERSMLNLATLQENQGRISEAEKSYQMAIDLNNSIARYNLAHMYQSVQQYEKALICYKVALAAGDTDALTNLGIVCAELEMFDDAEIYLQDAVKYQLEESVSNLGIFYRNMGRSDDVKNLFRAALERGVVESNFSMAMMHDVLGNLDEAERFYLLAISDGDSSAMHNLGLLCENQDRFEDAEKHYLESIKAGNNETLFRVAVNYEKMGRLSDAEIFYKKSWDSGSVEALVQLGILCAEQDRVDEAEIFFLEAVSLRDHDALNNLGVLYGSMGRFKDSEKYFKLAIESGIVVAMQSLSSLYSDLNRGDEAKRYSEMHSDASRNKED